MQIVTANNYTQACFLGTESISLGLGLQIKIQEDII